MKTLFAWLKRNNDQTVETADATPGSASPAHKREGIGINAAGAMLVTTDVISSPVVKHGINLSLDGVVQVVDSAPGAGAISNEGFAVTNGSLHVSVGGVGFTNAGRLSITTGGEADVTAPTLSSPSMASLTDVGGVPTVTTDEDNGTIYFAVLTDGGSATDVQIKAGAGGNIVAGKAGSKAVSATGVQTFDEVTGLTSNTAYEVVFLHTDDAENDSDQSTVGFTTDFIDETNALAAEMDADGTAPDATRKGHINTLISTLKANGVWAKLDRLWVLAAHEETAALINWVAPGTDTLTKAGTPTFTADQGFTGNGTDGSLNSGTNYSALTLFQRNSAHVSIWSRSNTQTANFDFGQDSGSHLTGFRIRNAADISSVLLNGGTYAPAQTAGNGHFISDRPDANNIITYRNGVAYGAGGSVASSAPPNVVPCILRSLTSFGTKQIAAVTLGASLGATDADDLYDALQAYMTAVGA